MRIIKTKLQIVGLRTSTSSSTTTATSRRVTWCRKIKEQSSSVYFFTITCFHGFFRWTCFSKLNVSKTKYNQKSEDVSEQIKPFGKLWKRFQSLTENNSSYLPTRLSTISISDNSNARSTIKIFIQCVLGSSKRKIFHKKGVWWWILFSFWGTLPPTTSSSTPTATASSSFTTGFAISCIDG